MSNASENKASERNKVLEQDQQEIEVTQAPEDELELSLVMSLSSTISNKEWQE